MSGVADNNKNIPKVIHFCWFGGKPHTKEVEKCINSWKRYCPEYEIKEWNEKNYDVYKNKYTEVAYKNKKWAFLSDYARLDVIYEEGGIYLDTDVELIKPLDSLLGNSCYFGLEQGGKVATGLGFGATKHHSFIEENKKYYEIEENVIQHNNVKGVTCVKITSDLLKERGLKTDDSKQTIGNITIYPTEFFCPKKLGTNRITITKNTYSIHHYDASWKSEYKVLRKVSYYLIPLKQFIKRWGKR